MGQATGRDGMIEPLARMQIPASKAWLRALEMTARIEDAPTRTLPVLVEELGARFGEGPALIGPQEAWSHAQLAARTNAWARWAARRTIT